MIYFTTKAYNAEHTLRRAVESILCQTNGDFCYHLCDNGSTDGTGEIIREYAKLDKRIVPFFNKRNMEWTPESRAAVPELMFHLGPEDWFAVLDADDDFTSDFLEEMQRFVREYELDFAACRSNHIQEPSGVAHNEVTLTEDIIVEGDDFGTQFPNYFRYMGAKWAKLQKGTLFQRFSQAELDRCLATWNLSHRHDTATELYYLRFSHRAGVRAKMLHNYHLYPVSHSTQNLASKERDNEKMPEIYREFLRNKVGYVSEENETYILELLERSQRRTRELENRSEEEQYGKK